MSQPANTVGRRIAVYALLALPFSFGAEDPRPTNAEPTKTEYVLDAGGSFGLRAGDEDKSPDVVSKGGGCSGLLVNNTSDTVDANPGNGVCADAGGNCTLRAAVMETNASSALDDICLPPGTFPLTIADTAGDENAGATGDLDITQDVTIVGDVVPGATIIDANGTSGSPRRIFDLQPGLNDPGVVFLGLTLTDGFAAGRGGAIRVQNNSDLLAGLVFLNNNFAVASGGGIAFEGTSSGSLTTMGITGNSVGPGAKGGGLFVDTAVFVSVFNTEFSGNFGPSPDNVGGIHTLGTLNMTNVTISGNRSLSGTGLQVEGGTTSAVSVTFADNALAAGDFEAERLGGQLTLENTILGGDPLRNCSGLIASASGNIDTGTTCGFATGDLSNTNPLLGLLYANGGFTNTHALPAGSPAINFATSSNCTTGSTDQRGVPRPQGPACDSGAYERRLFGLSINDVSIAEGNSGTSTATFTVTLTPANPTQTVTVIFSTGDNSATFPLDYTPTSGLLTFNPGETSKPVSVTINGDTTTEPNETFFVNLTNPVNADFDDAQGVGTITNDDAAALVDLSLVKSDSPDPVAAGATLTYSLVVSNAGPAVATLLTLTDTLPAGTSFVSASGPGWTCNQNAGIVACTLPTLAVAGSSTVTIAVLAPSSAGTITNLANVTASETDPAPANNSDSESTTVTAPPSADLSLTKSDSPDPISTGGTLTYSLSVANAGPSAATSLVLTDTLPTGVTSPTASGPGWSCVVKGSVVTCSLASLASGSSSIVTIQATAPLTAGTVTNSANVTSATTDPNSANNSDAETTGVTSCSALAAPANLTANLVGTTLFLNWDPVTGAERYIVELFSQPIANPTANFFGTDLMQPAGTVLVFQVRAECGGAASGPSNSVTVVVPPLNCATPSAPALSISPVALGQPAVLTWTDTLAGRPGVYRVSRSVDGGPFTEVAVTSGTSFTTPAVTLEDVPRTILYVVRAELLCGGTTLVGPESAGVALCILPSPVSDIRLENAFNPSAPISPVDPIRILWQAGQVPGVSYAYRINGATAPPFAGTTTETSVVVPPAGLDFTEIEAFVTAFRCQPATDAASSEARSEPVTVANLPPVAEYTISPNPRAGAPTTFTDTSLRAVTYLWTTNEGQTATTQHFTITFSTPGDKEVALIVSNGVGTDTEIKRFTVGSAAATVARALARAEPFVAANPEQRRAPVRIPGQGTTTLRIVSKEEETVVIYLRLLDENGRSVFEKRLVVAGGAEALYDIGAWGFRGDYTVELVSRRRFEADVLGGRPTGRPSPREVRR